MTALKVRRNGVFTEVGGAAADPWVRPADWLALPVLTVGQQKCVGLMAVYPGNSNWVALNAAGAFTVDWGDGSAPENFGSGAVAQHNVLYSSVPSGTLTSKGYRQAIVTVTPQGGQTLTTLQLGMSITGVQNTSSLWLDVAVVGASISTLATSGGGGRPAFLMEQFTYIGPCACTSLASVFSGSRALRSIIGTEWTQGVTTFSGMFNTCTSLTDAGIPALDTSTGTNFSTMFYGCSSLQTIPLLDTAAGTNFSDMFNLCTSLRTIPLLNTAAGTNFSQMFLSCSVLTEIPLLNTGAGTNFSGMFYYCVLLTEIPLLNTGAGRDFTNMFYGCSSLQMIPLLNTAAGTTFSSMFSTCTVLQVIPFLNTAAGTNFSSMFSGSQGLQVGALSGTSRSISYATCKLKGTELDAIYTGLATVNTNLLSANASSIETSNADWGTNLVNISTSQRSANAIADGANSLRLTSTATGEATAAITTRLAVSASTAYTFMAYVATNGSTRQARVKIGWYDAGGALISTSTGSDVTSGTVLTVFTQCLVQATSPAGAVTASVIVSWTSLGATQDAYFDKMGLFPGTVTAWQIGGAQTITVSTNWDVANDTPSIATAKGWTVTG